ncbi:hypothetical protein GMA8713_01528 [Grimontia marina]|uniref:Uncharacterized protein n=1 Tax=Grimontia marina TaxID=646534 RepID=A0A128F1I0_9GAMM|nr:hypothetical protein GMA8713_01528 [Grimontia marina]
MSNQIAININEWISLISIMKHIAKKKYLSSFTSLITVDIYVLLLTFRS